MNPSFQYSGWVEAGINDEMVEKIFLSSDERVFRRSRVTSEALKRRDNGVFRRKTELLMKSKGYGDPVNKNQETPENTRWVM